MSTTRERIVDASAELMRRQGYAATGVKQIVTEARAPFGSLYHHFPGGKEQLGAESVRVSGALYELLIPAVFDPAPDLVSAVRAFFAGAAEHLRETDFEDACQRPEPDGLSSRCSAHSRARSCSPGRHGAPRRWT